MPRANQDRYNPLNRVPRTLFQHAHIDGLPNFPAIIHSGAIAYVFMLMPDNLNGLDSLTLWLLGGATEATTIDITIEIGTCDEAHDTHTQTVNNHAVNLVFDEYECVDLTAIFATVLANITSRDMIWLTVSGDGENTQYCVGLELQET